MEKKSSVAQKCKPLLSNSVFAGAEKQIQCCGSGVLVAKDGCPNAHINQVRLSVGTIRRDIQDAPAMLAVNGIGVMAMQPAVGTIIDNA